MASQHVLTLWKGGNIIHFFGHAKYVRIHIGSSVLVYVQDRLNSYNKGSFFFYSSSGGYFNT